MTVRGAGDRWASREAMERPGLQVIGTENAAERGWHGLFERPGSVSGRPAFLALKARRDAGECRTGRGTPRYRFGPGWHRQLLAGVPVAPSSEAIVQHLSHAPMSCGFDSGVHVVVGCEVRERVIREESLRSSSAAKDVRVQVG